MAKSVLITGASSGIGYAFANRFAKAGYQLVLTGRNQESLQKIETEFKDMGHDIIVIPKDLKDVRQVFELYEETKSLQIDVLVNNAGFGQYGYFHQTNLSNELDMITVNISCVTILTKLFLQDMVKQNRGTIINVSSTAAFQPVPLMNVYGATKSYVLSLTGAIASELAGSNVHVMAVCPGSTETDFHRRAGSDSLAAHKHRLMSATDVAEATFRAMLNKNRLVIPGWKNKIVSFAYRLLPRNTLTELAKRMYLSRKLP